MATAARGQRVVDVEPLCVADAIESCFAVRLQSALGWLVSTILHWCLLIMLALIMVPLAKKPIDGCFQTTTAVEDEMLIEEFAIEELDVEIGETTREAGFETPPLPTDESGPDDLPRRIVAQTVDDARRVVEEPIHESVLYVDSRVAKHPATGGFSYRCRNRIDAIRCCSSATQCSEGAVSRALVWLAAHQQEDGSWSFDHRAGACSRRCRHPGNLPEAKIAATSLGLLPFLGAGSTHRGGSYRHVVQRGLEFLKSRRKETPDGDSLFEPGGRMYSHALATLVLCEAYGMTCDVALRQPAQEAARFIVAAQDPNSGGWRYTPGSSGDTSVFGWQLIALKSAKLAGLRVPPAAFARASQYLDSVAYDRGASYGYLAPGDGLTTTSIGMLSRMMLGVKRNDPALRRGVARLDEVGPSLSNLYYDYYATQIMLHYGGNRWTRWNRIMRDWLVDTQDRAGHEKGSWHLDAKYAAHGGRLYTTAMAALILEVYYRHLPIYEYVESDAEFPLE